MRALRVVLLLLTTLGAGLVLSAPSKLVDSPAGGNLPYDFYIAMCAASGPPACGVVRHVPKATPWNCTEAYFPKPAVAGPYSCWIESAPAVAANPLPTWGAPVAPLEPPKPFVACLPEIKADFWSTAYKIGDVPSIVSTRYTKYVVWKGKASCGGKVQGQLYSLADSAQFLANAFKSDAEVNAWTASQPLEIPMAAETRFLGQMIDAYKQVVTPVPPVTVTYRTTAQSSTDPTRQVYKANASGTGIGSAITGVRVMQGTPCGPKLGTTNYCSVAGQKDAQGRVIASGYAIGTAVQ